MTLALTLAVMQATGVAARFEARDLTAVARALQDEEGPPEEKAFFTDLLALVGCRAPAPVETGASLPRVLVRIEAARGARLLATSRTAGTVWEELRRRDAFRRELPQATSGRVLLAWPDEGERWPDEEKPLPAGLLEWRCDAPAPSGDELEVLTVEAVDALARAAKSDVRYAPVAARIRWQRAVRLLSAGRRDEAAAAARVLTASALDSELQPWATFLRLELALDPEDGWTALLSSSTPEVIRTAALLHSARALALQKNWQALISLTEGGTPRNDAAAEQLLFLRTLARLRRGGEPVRDVLLNAFSERQPPPALVELALNELARGPLTADDLAFAKKLLPGERRLPERLAARALAAGNVEGAARAAEVLASDRDPLLRVQGLALQADLSMRRGDVRGWDRAVAAMYAEGDDAPKKLRDARDRALASFAPRWVIDAPAPSRSQVRSRLASLADRMARRERTDVERALASADGARVVNAGTVEVAVEASLPPLPELQIDWPEPYSLLAIPGSDGEVHSWIGRSR